jgi:UrcA family protein
MPAQEEIVMSPMNRNRGTLTGPTAAPLMTALLCTAVFMTTGAIAAPQAVNAVNVSYVKADLTQPESAQSLYKRIQQTARTVCQEPSIRELARYEEYRHRYESAVDAAVAKVDATALTAIHRSRTQRSAAG